MNQKQEMIIFHDSTLIKFNFAPFLTVCGRL